MWKAILPSLALASVAFGKTTTTLRQTEAEEAAIKNAVQECTAYDFPAVDKIYYDYLNTIDQKATLFCTILSFRSQVESNSGASQILDRMLLIGQGQRGLADGHEICSHTWSHPYMTAMTNEQAFAELYYSKKIIKDILVGDVDDRIRWIANQLDMVTIVWEEDTDDWDWSALGVSTIKKNYENILARQANGTYDTFGPIVLTHEIDNETMVLSEEFLPQMQKAFTGGVMPIAVCMNQSQPYAESNGSYVYPNYSQWAAGTRTIQIASPTAVTKDVRLLFGSATGVSSHFKSASTSASFSSAATQTLSATTTSEATTAAATAVKATSGATHLTTFFPTLAVLLCATTSFFFVL
ncbi:hypothetical protein P7C70_g5506, partial [Phenoliferia sp. Uapishka_3]